MLKTLAAAVTAVLLAGAAAHAADISGAGATFPAPVYAKWAEAYKRETGVGLNYQAIGSGGGIKQITAKTVDFGASDKPLKPEQLSQIGLIQFPTVMGGVVPVVNLPGVAAGQLKLNGDILAKIYLGEIKRWSDPAIAGLNGGVHLPNLPITVGNWVRPSLSSSSGLSGMSDAPKSTVLAVICLMPPPEPMDW